MSVNCWMNDGTTLSGQLSGCGRDSATGIPSAAAWQLPQDASGGIRRGSAVSRHGLGGSLPKAVGPLWLRQAASDKCE